MKFQTLADTRRALPGAILWGVASLVVVLLVYMPFEQPFLLDDAYNLYMAQVVMRGEVLYRDVIFGYTPLGPVTWGYAMSAAEAFGVSPTLAARVVSLMVYGLGCALFYALAAAIYRDRLVVHITTALYVGIGFLSQTAAMPEPKLWVIALLTGGTLAFASRRWFLTGFLYALAAMFWQVAVISFLPLAILLATGRLDLFKSLPRIVTGALVGLVPAVLYVTWFGVIDDFWIQGVIRKFSVEGANLGERPAIWFEYLMGWWLRKDKFTMIYGLLSLGLIIVFALKYRERMKRYVKNAPASDLVTLQALAWIVFASLEVQGAIDLLPLFPFAVMATGFCTAMLFRRIRLSWLHPLVIGVIVLYAYRDLANYFPRYTWSDQQTLVKQLDKKYPMPFVHGFEEYYAVVSRDMPTKYVRFNQHHEFMLERSPGDCTKMETRFHKEQVPFLIMRNDNALSLNSCLVDSFLSSPHTIPIDTFSIDIVVSKRNNTLKPIYYTVYTSESSDQH